MANPETCTHPIIVVGTCPACGAINLEHLMTEKEKSAAPVPSNIGIAPPATQPQPTTPQRIQRRPQRYPTVEERRLTIQLALQSIPLDEPIFVLRAQDSVAANVIRDWCQRARMVGAKHMKIHDAELVAGQFEAFDSKRKKVPD